MATRRLVGEGCRGSHEQGNGQDLILVFLKTWQLTLKLDSDHTCTRGDIYASILLCTHILLAQREIKTILEMYKKVHLAPSAQQPLFYFFPFLKMDKEENLHIFHLFFQQRGFYAAQG